MKQLFLTICGTFIIYAASSQNLLTGRVFENKTNVFLSGVKIENLITHVVAVSNADGSFSIKANVGDKLTFSGFSYLADTLYLVNLKPVIVYLNIKRNMLNEVKVVTPEVKTGSLTAPAPKGPFGSDEVRYQTDGAGNYIGGVKLMIFEGNYSKKKKRDKQIFINDERQQQIAAVFNAKNLHNYLPIAGQEMDNFIILFTPDIKTYYNTGFNLTSYLNTCYQKFLQIPAEKRQSKAFLALVPQAEIK